jgi:hypothetical protein
MQEITINEVVYLPVIDMYSIMFLL